MKFLNCKGKMGQYRSDGFENGLIACLSLHKNVSSVVSLSMPFPQKNLDLTRKVVNFHAPSPK